MIRFGVSMAVLLWCTVAAAQAALEQPQPAPKVYVTDNYGLIATIPRGLTYCRLPEGWSGSDHGTVLFLEPPTGCIPSRAYASSSRPTPEFVPAIYLYYEYNVAEIDRGNGKSSPPRTSAEYTQLSCEKPFSRVPSGLKLLGKPASGCRHDGGDRTELSLAALYNSGHNGVIVTLSTTGERFSQDLHTLSELASAISECKPSWDKQKSGRPPCPHAPWW